MSRPSSPSPDPRRSEIARRNRAKRRGLTSEGRERIRAAILAHRVWEHSTGPRTAEGKARSARNGWASRPGCVSHRERRKELAGVFDLIREMATTRRSLM